MKKLILTLALSAFAMSLVAADAPATKDKAAAPKEKATCPMSKEKGGCGADKEKADGCCKDKAKEESAKK